MPTDPTVRATVAIAGEALRQVISSLAQERSAPRPDPLRAWREAAAVLSSVDPGTLQPHGEPSAGTSGLDLLSELVRMSDSESAQPYIWTLPVAARRAALQSLGSRDALRSSLAANPARPSTVQQQMLTRLIEEESFPDIQKLGLDEARALLTATEWLHGILPEVPNPAILRKQVEQARDETAWKRLADAHFAGREDELGEIRRHIAARDPSLLFLAGPGGIGKSTLFAKTLLEAITEPGETTPPRTVLLDFDDPSVDQQNPVSLLTTACQQLARRDPSLANLAAGFVQHWSSYLFSTDDLYLESNAPIQHIAGQILREFVQMIEPLSARGEEMNRPLLCFVDTFEEVQFFGPEVEARIIDSLLALTHAAPFVRIVVCGRATPSEQFQGPGIKIIPVPGLPPAVSRKLLVDLVQAEGKPVPAIPEERWDSLVQALQGNPLTLRLAASAIAREGPALLSDPKLLEIVETEVLQRYLYTRLLGHLRSKEIIPIAMPGLVVRKITAEIIRDVLAEPCKLGAISKEKAEELFSTMGREVSLVSRERDGSLRHRPDVRRVMLRSMPSQLSTAIRKIDEGAVRYWSSQEGPEARAEEIYHRLRVRQDAAELSLRWVPHAAQYFTHLTLEEFEPGSAERVWLAAHLQVGLTSSERMQISQADWEQQISVAVQRLLQAGKGEEALTLLHDRPENDRLPGSELWLLEARTLLLLKREKEAITIAQRGMDDHRKGKTDKPALAIETLLLIGWMEEGRRDFQSARQVLQEALTLAQQAMDTLSELRILIRILRLDRESSGTLAEDVGHRRISAVELVRSLGYSVLANQPALLRETAAELGANSILDSPDGPNVLEWALDRLGEETFQSLSSRELSRLKEEIPVWTGVPLNLPGARKGVLIGELRSRFEAALHGRGPVPDGMQRRLALIFQKQVSHLVESEYVLKQSGPEATAPPLENSRQVSATTIDGLVERLGSIIDRNPGLLQKAAESHLGRAISDLAEGVSALSATDLTRNVLKAANRIGQLPNLVLGLEENAVESETRRQLADVAAEIDLKPPAEIAPPGRPPVVVSPRFSGISELILDTKDEERVSLKQTQKNPWDETEQRFPIGSKVKGKVTNLVPYGAFVEIEEGVEGLIHVSELSWTKRITRPSDVLAVGQELEAVVLGVNKEEQKISLGVRQLEPNPWDEIEHRYQIGKQVKGTVRNMTAYGAFVELEEGIDGMIHVSDMSWTRKINHPSEMLKKGDELEAVVIDIDKQNQRISLGIKQLEGDPWREIEAKYKIGDKVKGKVSKIATFGAFVELEGDIDGLVHISQIREDRVEKVKDVLQVGQEIEARVIKVDKSERRIGLSIKAVNYNDEDIQKEAAAFKPGEDMVGLDQPFASAREDYRTGQK